MRGFKGYAENVYEREGGMRMHIDYAYAYPLRASIILSFQCGLCLPAALSKRL